MSEKKRFLLRLDEGVYDKLERWSADELRSVNAQIEYLLVDALKRAGRYSKPGATTLQSDNQRNKDEGQVED